MAEYNPKDPLVAEAKRVARAFGKQGAIVVLIGEDDTTIRAASYGHTKEFCRTVGQLMDQLLKPLMRVRESGAQGS